MKFYSKENCYDALKEADISTACLLDGNYEGEEGLMQDLEHILNQIHIAIEYIDSVSTE